MPPPPAYKSSSDSCCILAASNSRISPSLITIATGTTPSASPTTRILLFVAATGAVSSTSPVNRSPLSAAKLTLLRARLETGITSPTSSVWHPCSTIFDVEELAVGAPVDSADSAARRRCPCLLRRRSKTASIWSSSPSTTGFSSPRIPPTSTRASSLGTTFSPVADLLTPPSPWSPTLELDDATPVRNQLVAMASSFHPKAETQTAGNLIWAHNLRGEPEGGRETEKSTPTESLDFPGSTTQQTQTTGHSPFTTRHMAQS